MPAAPRSFVPGGTRVAGLGSVVVVALCAGCFTPVGPEPISQGTAGPIIDAALAELAASARGEETRLRAAHLNETTWKGSSFEGGSFFDVEWGPHATTRLRYTPMDDRRPVPDAGGLTLSCLETREFLEAPNGTFEARRGTGWCVGFVDSSRPWAAGDDAALATMLGFARNGTATVDAAGNARAQAVETKAAEPGPPSPRKVYDVTVSPDGRILALGATTRDRSQWTFEYGERQPLVAPDPVTDRLAAPIRLAEEPGTAERREARMVASEEFPFTVPRSELALRVFREGAQVAEFPLDRDASLGGLSFSFGDRDGDGLASPEDTLLLTGSGLGDVTLVLHDEWAGHDVGYNPYRIPGPDALLAGVALAGAVLVARRRR